MKTCTVSSVYRDQEVRLACRICGSRTFQRPDSEHEMPLKLEVRCIDGHPNIFHVTSPNKLCVFIPVSEFLGGSNGQHD